MTYEETLEKIHSFLRFGSRLGLHRMKELLRRLGNPERDLNVIHVAGTNGKGSVSRYLYCVLEDCGYKTGLYASPFLERFTERIEFHGKEISHADLSACGESVFAAVEEMTADGNESPTEFEVVTAIAFVYFKRKKTDYVILEVGLGGNGDSTNVIEKPMASVITSVSFDHMAQLGSTLEAIAGEKAGIIKVGCPVVSGVSGDGEKVLKTRAAGLNADFVRAAELKIETVHSSLKGSTFDLVWDTEKEGQKPSICGLEIGMAGIYQIENARCAYRTLLLLAERGKVQISETALRSGFLRARQPGRMELLWDNPIILIDGAHNTAGAQALADSLRYYFPKADKQEKPLRILLVLGMLADKEVDKMLDIFAALPCEFAAAEPDNPRKLPSARLAQKMMERQPGRNCPDLGDSQAAADYIYEHRGEYDVIIEAGSLYLIGALRGKMNDGKECRRE